MKNNPVYKCLEETVTLDPTSLVTDTEATMTATVTGAALGDFVIIAPPYDLQGIMVTGYVSAANTVTIRLRNGTAGTIDLASGEWKIRIYK